MLGRENDGGIFSILSNLRLVSIFLFFVRGDPSAPWHAHV